MKRFFLFWILAVLWPDYAKSAIVVCQGVDDTATIQQAVDLDSVVRLEGACKVNGWAGIRISSGKSISGGVGVSVALIPGCTSQGWPCRIFETIPGHSDITIRDLVLLGELNSIAKYQILIRVDSSTVADGERWGVRIQDVTCLGAKSDCIYVGGNVPSKGVRILDVAVDGFGRNGIAVTHADDVVIDGLDCQNAKPGADPGACVDVESNAGESTANITITNVTARNTAKGAYLHRHSASTKNGQNLKVADSNFDVRQACIISNSGDHVAILDNVCRSAQLGISVGSHYEDTRSNDVVVWGNDVTAVTDVMLAGVRDVAVEANMLRGGGRVQTAALGVVGKIDIDNGEPANSSDCR